ncbi:ATP-binding protein [Edaphovirga cremea]|uniref:ATP-binding protein n=1 Tax=Edaphovirga cremea TaxID=2267246 RepID=UPI000DF016D3|nr:ATP-binding protein [Edaphovirga cremea]
MDDPKTVTEILTTYSGVAKRFSESSLVNFKTVNQHAKDNLAICQRFVDEWPALQATGSNLLFCGQVGTGKTHLSVGIMRALFERYDADVYLTTAQRIIRAVRDTWRPNAARTEYDVLGFYSDVDLLVIDEVGMQSGTDSERLIVSEIINIRYEQMKPIILISNFTVQEIEGFIGYRAMDRVMESAVVLAFDWESQRVAQ